MIGLIINIVTIVSFSAAVNLPYLLLLPPLFYLLMVSTE